MASPRVFAVGHVSYRLFGELVFLSLGQAVASFTGNVRCPSEQQAIALPHELMLFQAMWDFFAEFLASLSGRWGQLG